jgi:cellulose synthase (UDP-forming)
MTSVRLTYAANDSGDIAEAPSHIHLDRLGWTEISVTSRSGQVLLAQLQPSFEQRAQLVVRLFSASHSNVAETASLRGALAGLTRRAFLGN